MVEEFWINLKTFWSKQQAVINFRLVWGEIFEQEI